MNQRIRTPVAAVIDKRLGAALIVCDDGAAFYYDPIHDSYSQCAPVPGTMADRAAEPVGANDPRD